MCVKSTMSVLNTSPIHRLGFWLMPCNVREDLCHISTVIIQTVGSRARPACHAYDKYLCRFIIRHRVFQKYVLLQQWRDDIEVFNIYFWLSDSYGVNKMNKLGTKCWILIKYTRVNTSVCFEPQFILWLQTFTNKFIHWSLLLVQLSINYNSMIW